MSQSRCSISLLLFAVSIAFTSAAQDRTTFPGANWTVVASPADLGWSVERLADAKAFSETLDTAAVIIVHHGVVVDQWGETEKPFMVHSMRKSILSALFGVYVESGKVDLSKTLAELGIDDIEPSLTDTEKTATVADLMTARSGVYHPAAYEPASMQNDRPLRGSHAPGTFWFYNNWDFNALCTIFEQETGTKIFEEFQRQLVQPLGMQNYTDKLGNYLNAKVSKHPAYLFRLSARDLARFGLLMARGGVWNDKQLIPKDWVAASTKSYSEAWDRGGFGYMWWTTLPGESNLFGVETEPGAFGMSGLGGHRVFILPKADLVIVHRVDTFKRDAEVGEADLVTLMGKILAARPAK